MSSVDDHDFQLPHSTRAASGSDDSEDGVFTPHTSFPDPETGVDGLKTSLKDTGDGKIETTAVVKIMLESDHTSPSTIPTHLSNEITSSGKPKTPIDSHGKIHDGGSQTHECIPPSPSQYESDIPVISTSQQYYEIYGIHLEDLETPPPARATLTEVGGVVDEHELYIQCCVDFIRAGDGFLDESSRSSFTKKEVRKILHVYNNFIQRTIDKIVASAAGSTQAQSKMTEALAEILTAFKGLQDLPARENDYVPRSVSFDATFLRGVNVPELSRSQLYSMSRVVPLLKQAVARVEEIYKDDALVRIWDGGENEGLAVKVWLECFQELGKEDEFYNGAFTNAGSYAESEVDGSDGFVPMQRRKRRKLHIDCNDHEHATPLLSADTPMSTPTPKPMTPIPTPKLEDADNSTIASTLSSCEKHAVCNAIDDVDRSTSGDQDEEIDDPTLEGWADEGKGDGWDEEDEVRLIGDLAGLE